MLYKPSQIPIIFMKNLQELTLSKLVVDESDIRKLKKEFSNQYVFESINPKLKDDYISDGWEHVKDYKTTTKVKKLKTPDRLLEERMWVLLSNMGYSCLNKDRLFKLPYGNSESETHQIDVFAKGDDTIIIVECKASTSPNKTVCFKKEIESYKGILSGLYNSIHSVFNDKKYKVKFVFATDGYEISDDDKNRLDSIHATLLVNDNIEYFENLHKQLGEASRYQFFGYIFDNQEIASLDMRVPAVRGKMGGHVYYSFAIEPAKLLNIGYVLHNNKAHINEMPTYQRLIKKKRLIKVRDFIDNQDGYFPNSVVINIDEDCRFDRANTQVKTTISDVGILYLPNRYKSAYIIDGQHRLYGYSGSKHATNNTIPVVAFIKLRKEEQVRLFTQINENQSPVPKSLRETLKKDLFWYSEDKKEQLDALCSAIAIRLGEDMKSSLFGQVEIGEDKRPISMSFIKKALREGRFLGSVNKQTITELGLMYNGNIDESMKKLLPYLIKCINYLKDNVDAGKEYGTNGLVFMNSRGIYGFIRVLSDILDYIQKEEGINVIKASVQTLYDATYPYITPIAYAINNIDEDEHKDLKKSYGTGEERKYWRFMQKAVRAQYESFDAPGLDEYIASRSKQNVDKAFGIIRDIESYFKNDAKQRLQTKYGKDWYVKGVPPKFAKDAQNLAFDKNREREEGTPEYEPWDCLTLIAYKEIAINNWADCFDKAYTAPWATSGNKQQKTEWIQQLERIRNQCFHSYVIMPDDLELIEKIHAWLIKK